MTDDPRLAKIRADRGYTYTDVVNVCPDKLPQYEDKIKSFYKEHIHYGESQIYSSVVTLCMVSCLFLAKRFLWYPYYHPFPQMRKFAIAWTVVATLTYGIEMINGLE